MAARRTSPTQKTKKTTA